MENPVEEIPQVIRGLTQTAPSAQQETLERYFTSDAAFNHPFCRVDSFAGSRSLVHYIYRWYKVMSPTIELDIHSVAYDERNRLLYVTLSQVFRIWAVPLHRARVRLTTVLQLRRDGPRYYIQSQNDLYQTDQFVRFVLPVAGAGLVVLAQLVATALCVVGATLLYPVTWVEEAVARRKGEVDKTE